MVSNNVFPKVDGLVFVESSPGDSILGTYYGVTSNLPVFSPLDDEELTAFVVWAKGMGDDADEPVLMEIGEKVEEGYSIGDYVNGRVQLQSETPMESW